MIARAIASRWRSPPLSVAGNFRRCSARPSWASISSARASASARGRPARIAGTATFSRTVRSSSRWKNWKTKPTFARRNRAAAVSLRRSTRTPSTTISPDVGRSSAADEVEQRRLAAARRAHDRGDPPGLDVEVDRVERGARRSRVALADAAQRDDRFHRVASMPAGCVAFLQAGARPPAASSAARRESAPPDGRSRRGRPQFGGEASSDRSDARGARPRLQWADDSGRRPPSRDGRRSSGTSRPSWRCWSSAWSRPSRSAASDRLRASSSSSRRCSSGGSGRSRSSSSSASSPALTSTDSPDAVGPGRRGRARQLHGRRRSARTGSAAALAVLVVAGDDRARAASSRTPTRSRRSSCRSSCSSPRGCSATSSAQRRLDGDRARGGAASGRSARPRSASASAVAEERRTMARELHDVVAHGVSVMVIQAGAARQVVRPVAGAGRGGAAGRRGDRSRGDGRAAPAPRRARRRGRGAGVAPQPGIDQIGVLLDRVREAGLPAELEVDGTPRPCRPASTSPSTGSSRRRSRTRCATRDGRRRSCD